MNYFAHARVAAGQDDDPAFVLGAMLPDFAHMIGERGAGLDHPGLRSGETHHHRADAAFHRAPGFVTLVRDAAARLVATGLARGPALACAHVGVELLLDGALVGDPRADAPYLEALRAAPALRGSIRWRGPSGARRFQRLQERLAAAGPPAALRDPARVTERLARTLEPRPRLRLAAHEHPVVERWVARARPAVQRVAPRLLAETCERL